MNNRKYQEKFAKMLSYVLDRSPDEFGLVPDAQGYVKIKDLLKALCEEDGWKHVRRSHLDEMILVIAEPPIEVAGPLVRAVHRDHLAPYRTIENPPSPLYVCVRKKAYPVVLDKGVEPGGSPFVVLSDTLAMAEKLGRRMTASVILLTVHAAKMRGRGIRFLHVGGALYLTEKVPPDCFTGPPIAKTREEVKPKEAPPQPHSPPQPGSFLLEIRGDASQLHRHSGRDKKSDWKRERRRMNRRGQRGGNGE